MLYVYFPVKNDYWMNSGSSYCNIFESGKISGRHLSLPSFWGGNHLEEYCHDMAFFFFFNFILLYNTVLVLPYIDMNPPRVYMRSQIWTPFPPPSPQHPSGSSLCASPKHAVSCIGHRQRERVGWLGRMALKHVYYHVRNESPVYFISRFLSPTCIQTNYRKENYLLDSV